MHTVTAPSSLGHLAIVSHGQTCLADHGDNHRGVGWPNYDDAQVRYQVMLDVGAIAAPAAHPCQLLDFGCGPSHLYAYLQARHPAASIQYQGLDLSEEALRLSRAKYPEITYHNLDVLTDAGALPEYDYIIMNGILTQKCTLSFDAMWVYSQDLLRALFAKARVGIAFNVASKQVDWERDDLFHLPMDLLAGFLSKNLSRHFTFRHDYGLYEYTTYLYHKPQPRR